MKKSLFWAFLGPAKVSRPLVITKFHARSENPPKNWIGRSGRPKMRRMNFWPVLGRKLKKSKNLCCQLVVFPSLSLLIWGSKKSERLHYWNGSSTCLWAILFEEVYFTSRHSYICTDYGRPMTELPSRPGRKSTPTPKFLGTAKACFVCHIGRNFQISLIYAFIGCP